MALTPEGKVKRQVTKLLKAATGVYYFMPVQTGYGSPTLDYLGSSRGRAFAIETKAPGKEPTMRQKAIINEMKAAGMKVFVIAGNPQEYEELRLWLF
jgi:phospholipase/lecithinase/hemolysin